jgi:hypothetical protein
MNQLLLTPLNAGFLFKGGEMQATIKIEDDVPKKEWSGIIDVVVEDIKFLLKSDDENSIISGGTITDEKKGETLCVYTVDVDEKCERIKGKSKKRRK